MLGLKVLGAGRHVGRSASLVHIDGHCVLLDCGIQTTNTDGDRFPDLLSLFQPLPHSVSASVVDVEKGFSCEGRNGTGPPWKRLRVDDAASAATPPHSSNSATYGVSARISTPLCPKDSYRCVADIVLITHFHLDHVAALPHLTEVLGFDGPILMTASSLSQAKLQLEDCWLNQEHHRSRETPSRVSTCEAGVPTSYGSNVALERPQSAAGVVSRDQEPEDVFAFSEDTTAWQSTFPNLTASSAPHCSMHKVTPFWNIPLNYDMIQRCLQRVSVLGFHQTITLGTLRITALPAGHVPGACMFLIEGMVTGHSVLYTGDYTTDGEQLMCAAQVPHLRPTLLISEATYGSQVRESKRAMERELCYVVESVVRQGGKVLIPMSGVGKAQELALLLAVHWKSRTLSVPIVLGSGMMERALDILKDCCHDWTSLDLEAFESITVMDVKAVLQVPNDTPVVYICPPRSLAAGVSLQMLRAWGTDPKNLILLVGFSVPGTVAHQIIKGSKTLKLPVDKTLNEQSYLQTGAARGIESLPPSAVVDPVSSPTHDASGRACKGRGWRRGELPGATTMVKPTAMGSGSEAFCMQAKMRYMSLASHADSLAIQNFVRYASPLMTVLVHGEAAGIEALTLQLQTTTKRPVWAPFNNETVIVCFGSPAAPLAPSVIRDTIRSSFDRRRHCALEGSPEGPECARGGVADAATSLRLVLTQQLRNVRRWLDTRWERCKTVKARPAALPELCTSENNVERCTVDVWLEAWCPLLLESLDRAVPRFAAPHWVEQSTLEALEPKEAFKKSVAAVKETPRRRGLTLQAVSSVQREVCSLPAAECGPAETAPLALSQSSVAVKEDLEEGEILDAS